MVSPVDNSSTSDSRPRTISSTSISRYLFSLLLLVSLAFNLYGAGWWGRYYYHRPYSDIDDVALDPAIWLGDLQTAAATANKNQAKKNKNKTPNVSSKKPPPKPPFPPSKDVVSSSELTAAAAAAPVVFFDRRDDIKCTISNSSISEMKYVGCGYSGTVFAVRMDCDEPVVGRSSAARPNSISRRKQTHKTIALKLLTSPANKTDKKKIAQGRIGIYKSESEDKQQKFIELYQRLISPMTTTTTPNKNNTNAVTTTTTAEDEKDKALRHFSIRLGSVSLSRSMIENTIDLVNPLLHKRAPYKRMVIDPDNTDGFVDGYLYSTIRDSKPFTSVGLGGRFREEGRHQEAVRDIIYIYWHSYRRGVIHCDMKLDHLMYSASINTTFMIDFDSYRLTPLPPGVRRDLQWQQWQCFSVIANICDRPAQQKQQKGNEVLLPTHMACNNHKSMKGLNQRETYATIFENCGFDRPMVWSDNMLKHTEETYQALADWSGMS